MGIANLMAGWKGPSVCAHARQTGARQHQHERLCNVRNFAAWHRKQALASNHFHDAMLGFALQDGQSGELEAVQSKVKTEVMRSGDNVPDGCICYPQFMVGNRIPLIFIRKASLGLS